MQPSAQKRGMCDVVSAVEIRLRISDLSGRKDMVFLTGSTAHVSRLGSFHIIVKQAQNCPSYGINQMTTNVPDPLDGLDEDQKREELLKTLQDAINNDVCELQIDYRLLKPWEDYTHPHARLIYSRKWAWQFVSKGFALGSALKVIFTFLFITATGYFINSSFVDLLGVLLGAQKIENVQFNWFDLWLIQQLGRFVSWLYSSDTNQIGTALKSLLVGGSLAATLLTSVCILGYFWGKIFIDQGHIGLGVNGLYHIDPAGQWFTPWSSFFAVRWTARTVCKQGKKVRYYHEEYPIRLLLPDGGSIRLWGCKADRCWLTKIMELLIAFHNQQPHCKISIRGIDSEAPVECQSDLNCVDQTTSEPCN